MGGFSWKKQSVFFEMIPSPRYTSPFKLVLNDYSSFDFALELNLSYLRISSTRIYIKKMPLKYGA